ncbi:ABC transporter permease [Vibrio viridaestus]|uniref:ABC transporter permease n=1 Tax=Vibrio viridaestus TaxID=2487322 RepID=A0A3N9TAT2_9VIBR|nr:ABC transporter permease [Vibrio viridaestus]RQW61241.1 ABC transporter permease [Vibrio viridaestus]
MFWILLIQSWKHASRRKVIAITTIFLAASLISALLAISIGIGDKMSKEMKSYGANIEIEPAGKMALPTALVGNIDMENESFIAESELPNIKDIFWRNNIMGFAPFVRGKIDVKGSLIPITGTFFDKAIPVPDEDDYRTGNKHISSYWHVDGKWPVDKENQVLIGKRLAHQNHWQQGQSLILNGNGHTINVTVSGLLSNGTQDDNAIIAPLTIAQTLLNKTGKVDSVKVSALTVPENALSKKAREDLESLDADEYDRWFCTAYVSSISHQLEQAMTNSVVKPLWQVAASEGQVINKIQTLLFVVTLAALIAAAMGIASLMTNSILERSKEIGLMKALGAFNYQIHWLFYLEATLCGVLGGLLGCISGWILSYIMGYALFGSPISYNWIVIPCVLLVSVSIALVGTWFPARKIAKLYPIEVLYGR